MGARHLARCTQAELFAASEQFLCDAPPPDEDADKDITVLKGVLSGSDTTSDYLDLSKHKSIAALLPRRSPSPPVDPSPAALIPGALHRR